MDNNEKYQLFIRLVKELFEKTIKLFPKKSSYFNDYSSFSKEISDKLGIETLTRLNADKYFPYMRMGLESENIDVIETTLEYMIKLIKEDFLNGNSEILVKLVDKTTQKESITKRKTIDIMIRSVIKIININDEKLWLYVIKLLYTIIQHCKNINGESITNIFKTCIKINLTSKTQKNIDTSKTALNYIISTIFDKMETSNSNIFAEKELGELRIETLSRQNSFNEKNNPLKYTIKNLVYYLEDLVSIDDYNNTLSSDIDNKSSFLNSTELNSSHNTNTNNFDNSFTTHGNPKTKTSFNRLIPYNTSSITNNPKNSFIYKPVELWNERGNPAGMFGWCFICRDSADFYCKDTRYPVCSFICKKRIVEDDQRLMKYESYGGFVEKEDIGTLDLMDCITIFKSICRLVNTSVTLSNDSSNVKSKLLSLNLLLVLLQSPGGNFLNKIEFIKMIKEDLMEGLLKNCLTNDFYLFEISLQVFVKIWFHFREHLKQHIGVFIEMIFLKVLDSGNTPYNFKLCVLDNLFFFAEYYYAKFFVELYINYDSDLNEKDLFFTIINTLLKITQGRYTKDDHMMQPQLEYSLRLKALDTIFHMLKSIYSFTFEQNSLGQKKYQNIDEIYPNMENEELNNPLEESTMMMDTTIDLKERLEVSRKLKQDISVAVDKFNLKPKNGISYLKKVGIISKDNEVEGIVHFLKNSNGLKKERIGEYLGEHHDITLKCLDYYTNTFDFKNLHIIQAIRNYLSGFLLPGEGQKIDRIMQKFAAKYFKDNSTRFNNPDCTYYLSFAIIMLQTDTHNIHVKNKMGLEGFTKICKGINGETDLDQEYLADIYEQIKNNPLTLIEHEEAKTRYNFRNSPTKKLEAQKRESIRIYELGTVQLKLGQDKQYISICEIEHIGPMIGASWSVLLATFSIMIEESEDNLFVSKSVEGIVYAIKLCGLLNLELPKTALIKAICKQTNLLQVKELKEKNVLCIKNVIHLAKNEGKILKGCWKIVLDIVSKIDLYNHLNTCSKKQLESFFTEIKINKKSLNIDKEILIEKVKIEKLSNDINMDDIDIIFNKTVNLNQESIIDFVESLCEVSNSELSNKDLQRIFSLQKLVEVAELNMGRVRILWVKIWGIISEHLVAVGSNTNPIIAEKAIDSLRQLAKKFLNKEEDSVYNFQAEFLKPFEEILKNNINIFRTKEFVITCIKSLVMQQTHMIKSGWKVIFNIFNIACDDINIEIIKTSFEMIEKISRYHFDSVKEYFSDLANSIKKFSKHYPERCVRLFEFCFQNLDDNENIVILFSSLSLVITNVQENERNFACQTFFEILNNCPLNEEVFKDIFSKVLIPIIDDLKNLKITNTLQQVLILICELFGSQYHFSEAIIDIYLEKITEIITCNHEESSVIGIECLQYLIDKLCEIGSTDFWHSICVTLSNVFQKTIQYEFKTLNIEKLNNIEIHDEIQELVNRNIVNCIVQHNIIQLSESLVENYFKKIRVSDLNFILDCLHDSYCLAYDFNCEFEVRSLISSKFMSDLTQVAALFKQQKDGSALYFQILNKIYDESEDEKYKLSSKKKMIIASLQILKQFVERISFEDTDEYEIHENNRLIANMVPIIINHVIPSLIKINFENETDYFEEFTKRFLEMIVCNIYEIRENIKELLSFIFFKMSIGNNNEDEKEVE